MHLPVLLVGRAVLVPTWLQVEEVKCPMWVMEKETKSWMQLITNELVVVEQDEAVRDARLQPLRPHLAEV